MLKCKSCGSTNKEDSKECWMCGTKLTLPQNIEKVEEASAQKQEPVDAQLFAWYLVSTLFGIIGGFIAFFANYSKNPRAASMMLAVGIVMTIFAYLFGKLFLHF